MGDGMKKEINILAKPTFPLSKLIKKKDRAMCLEDTISACIRIINNILTYTSTLEPKETVFDMSSKPGCETDSDSADIDKDFDEVIDLDQFLNKCINYLDIDNNLLIFSMMLLDKVLKYKPDFNLSERNVQKVFFLCLMEAQKFLDDESFSNKDYAKIGSIEVNELLKLEIEFLTCIQFDLHISNEEFERYTNKLTQFWKTM